MKIKPDTIIYYHEITSKYYSLLNRLIPDYQNNAEKELTNAISYLRQEEIKGKIAVVDIGWHNSMQYCLEDLLNENGIYNEIYGLYFGVQSNGFEVKNSKGFIKELSYSGKSEYVDSTSAFIGLIESFFLEPKGTIIKYGAINGKYFPIRESYEYEENSMEYNAYADIHKGILKYVDIVRSLKNQKDLILSGQDAYLPIRTFGLNPYLYDVDKFNRFRYFSEGTYYLVGYKGILHYFTHISDFKKDLYNARWKIGFLKKLFKVNLPYYKIYLKLKKKA